MYTTSILTDNSSVFQDNLFCIWSSEHNLILDSRVYILTAKHVMLCSNVLKLPVILFFLIIYKLCPFTKWSKYDIYVHEAKKNGLIINMGLGKLPFIMAIQRPCLQIDHCTTQPWHFVFIWCLTGPPGYRKQKYHWYMMHGYITVLGYTTVDIHQITYARHPGDPPWRRHMSSYC